MTIKYIWETVHSTAPIVMELLLLTPQIPQEISRYSITSLGAYTMALTAINVDFGYLNLTHLHFEDHSLLIEATNPKDIHLVNIITNNSKILKLYDHRAVDFSTILIEDSTFGYSDECYQFYVKTKDEITFENVYFIACSIELLTSANADEYMLNATTGSDTTSRRVQSPPRSRLRGRTLLQTDALTAVPTLMPSIAPTTQPTSSPVSTGKTSQVFLDNFEFSSMIISMLFDITQKIVTGKQMYLYIMVYFMTMRII